jgi:chromosome segregation ATPase
VSERDELLARSRQTLEGLRAENARLLSQIDGLARERDDDARALATTRRAEEELARQLEAKDVDVMRLSEELRDVAAGLEKAKAQILKRRIYSDPIQQT